MYNYTAVAVLPNSNIAIIAGILLKRIVLLDNFVSFQMPKGIAHPPIRNHWCEVYDHIFINKNTYNRVASFP